jgi:DNA polymerase-3 subunit beta
MKVEITKKELHEALAGFSRVISRKTTLPVLHGIRFAAKDGQLHATATDLEQAATYTFASAVVARQGVCVVSCEALRPFAKGRDQEIVTMDAGEVLLVSHQISGHSISEQIPTFDAAEFPPDLPDIPTRKVEGHFLECFHRAQIFASRDETRPVLNTVRLEVSGQAKGDCIVATDGRRLISYNSQELPIKAGCNVKPTKFLNSLQHEPDMEIGEQTINDAQYFALKNGRWSYIARTVDGAYPNWRQVIPKYNNPRMLQFSDANAAVLTKVLPGFAGHDQKDGPITLVARHGRIKIYGLNKETGKWSVLALDEVGYQGGDSMVCLNRQFLLDVLRVGFRQFAYSDRRSPLLSEDSQGGLHVLMPMSLMKPEGVEVPAEQPETDAANAPVKIPAEKVDTPARAFAARSENINKPQKEEKMADKIGAEVNALDKILTAFEAAKAKLNEAKSALTEIADAVKLAVREQRSQKGELENARVLLGKLQAVKL